MRLIKKYRTDLVIGLALLILYFFSRLPNLTLIPIFTDEAIYLRWAQIMWHDSTNRFISLSDGKQPFFMWLCVPLMKMMADPLAAGRLLSVIAGAGSVVGIWLLSYTLFNNKKAAYLASLLYIVCPFFMMYDRLALVDSLLTTLSIWTLWLAVLMVKTLRLDTGLLTGLFLGANFLTKSPAVFSLYLMPATLLLSAKKFNFIRWTGLFCIIILLSQGIYNILRLSPMMHMVHLKDLNFILSWSEFFEEPFKFFRGNIRGLLDWLTVYMTPPVYYLTIVSLLYGLIKKPKEILLLFLYFFVPLLASAFLAKILYPRYLLYMVPFLLIITAYFISSLKINKYLFWGLLFLLLLPSIKLSFDISVRPVQAAIPLNDRGQFLDNWPSGYGIKESVIFFEKERKQYPIYIATDGTFGLLPFSLELYLVDKPNIKIAAFWPIDYNKLPGPVTEAAKSQKTYIIFNQIQKINPEWSLHLIEKYQKGKGDVYLRLYEVLPK